MASFQPGRFLLFMASKRPLQLDNCKISSFALNFICCFYLPTEIEQSKASEKQIINSKNLPFFYQYFCKTAIY
jgi:hypothetical protein